MSNGGQLDLSVWRGVGDLRSVIVRGLSPAGPMCQRIEIWKLEGSLVRELLL